MGTKYDLEARSCKCGCGRVFRVLKTSPQRYFAKHHDPDEIRLWNGGKPALRPAEEESDDSD